LATFQAILAPRSVYVIRVVPPGDSLHALQDVVPLTAVIADSSGNVITGTVAWSALDPTIVSLKPAGNQATATAVANGAARVVVSYKTVSDTIIIAVRQIPVQIAFANDNLIVAKGTTISVGAAAADSNGAPIPTETLTYYNSDSTIATVTQHGQLTGIRYGAMLAGVADLTAPAPPGSTVLSGSVNVTVAHQAPAQVVLGQFSASADHVCALSALGEPYCWGADDVDQASDYRMFFVDETKMKPAGNGLLFTSVAAGIQHSCGVASDGSVSCWGRPWVTFSTSDTAAPPSRISNLPAMSIVAVGTVSACALTGSGAAYCWGDNTFGELGNGSTTSSVSGVAVAGGLTFTAITVGGNFACGLLASGQAYCWGADPYGQLGTGADQNSYPSCGETPCANSPVPVAGSLAFVGLTAGYTHACGWLANGSAYCWGDNLYGELGVGNLSGPALCSPSSGGYKGWPCSTSPALVSAAQPYQRVSAGYNESCALDGTGAAYCWGVAYGGNTPAPQAVSGGYSFVWIGTTNTGACAVTVLTQAYCWGELDAPATTSAYGPFYGPTPVAVPHP
jgi:alpha-tubulin suppressor-like RCC1 family protein